MPSIIAATLFAAALVSSALAQSGCPGVLNDNTECCVGGKIPPLTLSSCAGWPICTGPVTVTTTSQPISCATIIPLSASDYSSLVASASSSLGASGTKYQTTIGGGSVAVNTAAESSAGVAASSSASAGSSGAKDVKLQAGLIGTGLLVVAGAFFL